MHLRQVQSWVCKTPPLVEIPEICLDAKARQNDTRLHTPGGSPSANPRLQGSTPKRAADGGEKRLVEPSDALQHQVRLKPVMLEESKARQVAQQRPSTRATRSLHIRQRILDQLPVCLGQAAFLLARPASCLEVSMANQGMHRRQWGPTTKVCKRRLGTAAKEARGQTGGPAGEAEAAAEFSPISFDLQEHAAECQRRPSKVGPLLVRCFPGTTVVAARGKRPKRHRLQTPAEEAPQGVDGIPALASALAHGALADDGDEVSPHRYQVIYPET